MTKLVMGSIVCIGPDDEEAIPYDDAVIHLEGDEDSEIEVHCPNAPAMAERIVKAVNSHDALVGAIRDFLETFDRCGGSESVSADEFAERRQRMRDLVGTSSRECK